MSASLSHPQPPPRRQGRGARDSASRCIRARAPADGYNRLNRKFSDGEKNLYGLVLWTPKGNTKLKKYYRYRANEYKQGNKGAAHARPAVAPAKMNFPVFH